MTRKFKTITGITLLVLCCLNGLRGYSQDLQAAFKLTRAERFEDANAAFKSLLQKNLNDGDVYYYFGDNYLQEYYSDTTNNSFKELSDSARILFTKGIEKDPANPLNYVGMGQIDLMIKNQTEAQQDFSKSISLLP